MYQHISPDDLDELLQLKFNPQEIRKLDSLNDGLHSTARTYLVRIFIRARLARKDFEQTYSACCQTLMKVWRFGTPGRLGDPDDVNEGFGLRNTLSFYKIYKTLGLESPKFLF